MRYWRIFLLNFQIVITERAISFVWFIIALIPPFVLYLYWRGALLSNDGNIAGWTLSTISTYYFMLVLASSTLIAHIEENVAREDIQQGELTKFLVKPFSYYMLKLFLEIPWRILQGFYGFIVLSLFIFFFKNLFVITTDMKILLLSIVIAILAFILSFTFKMIIGLSAFWLTDVGGFFQLVEAIILLCGGLLLPLSLLPDALARIAYILPFAYIIYFPIIALQGTQNIQQLMQIIAMQLFWIAIMAYLYSVLWKKGVKKFTGIGQ